MRKQKHSYSEALKKLRKYCAYQERCHKEIRQKLFDWGFGQEDILKITGQLLVENFLSEERFARAYVRGKFNQKKWGRLKIQRGLIEKGILPNLSAIAMKEIDDEKYGNTLQDLVEKKADALVEKNIFKKRAKVAQYVIRKGYEPDLVWEVVKDMVGE